MPVTLRILDNNIFTIIPRMKGICFALISSPGHIILFTINFSFLYGSLSTATILQLIRIGQINLIFHDFRSRLIRANNNCFSICYKTAVILCFCNNIFKRTVRIFLYMDNFLILSIYFNILVSVLFCNNLIFN